MHTCVFCQAIEGILCMNNCFKTQLLIQFVSKNSALFSNFMLQWPPNVSSIILPEGLDYAKFE